MKVSCPFCGSEDVIKQEKIDRYPVPFCADAKIKHSEYYCNECEEEGDFDLTADKKIIAAIKKAGAASAVSLMNDLVADGITMTYLEKALRIPFKTTARWKRGEISQSALALLRIIRFSPQLLQVADNNFSEHAQAMYQISRPCSFFGKWFDYSSIEMSKNGDETTISYTGYPGMKTPPQVESNTQTIMHSAWVLER